MSLFDFRAPASFRLTARDMGLAYDDAAGATASPFVIFKKPHDSHPSLDHLILLVFEAVMEVVCVSLPGYIIARLGHFDADKQKFLANLNVWIFTPCLIFTKLASQLNAEALVDLGVIPIIFIIQTLVSYAAATIVARLFRFNKRASNFVTAMGVFGNSNSLPISLVISLSQTLKGLHWDKVPGDNDDEVAARGILYLMIFQQLGQLVRWSWGYHVLLAPKDKYEEYNDERAEEGRFRDLDQGEDETENLIRGIDSTNELGEENHVHMHPHQKQQTPTVESDDSEVYEPAGRTPVQGTSRASPNDSEDEQDAPRKRHGKGYHNGDSNGLGDGLPDAVHAVISQNSLDGIHSFPRIRNVDEPEFPLGIQGYTTRSKAYFTRLRELARATAHKWGDKSYQAMPAPVQNAIQGLNVFGERVNKFIWEFMNPPLWAMLIAVLVASIPKLQELFFEEGSFIKNSVTNAVQSSGGVAVPLILVVLGANLARNTQQKQIKQGPDGQTIAILEDPEEKEIGTRLLIASLISRMLIPFLVMAPILAVFAKYVPVSILDDPIFIIVCFLLVGAPSALQLAQICQINNVYEGVMGRILFQSYVIWILPSTLILVMTALEVVEWAKPI